jgi:hypothetical protein
MSGDPTFSSAVKANHLVQMLIAFQKFQAPSEMHFALLSAKLLDYPRLPRFGPGIRLLGNMNLCAEF